MADPITKAVFVVARLCWWLGEWVEALGDSLEDVAFVERPYWRTPRDYRVERRI